MASFLESGVDVSVMPSLPNPKANQLAQVYDMSDALGPEAPDDPAGYLNSAPLCTRYAPKY